LPSLAIIGSDFGQCLSSLLCFFAIAKVAPPIVAVGPIGVVPKKSCRFQKKVISSRKGFDFKKNIRIR